MRCFLQNTRYGILLILCALILSACAGSRDFTSRFNKETQPTASHSVVLMPITGLSDIENSQFFASFQAYAAQKGIAVLKDDGSAVDGVSSFIQGYVLNDPNAQTVSMVFDMLAPDNSRQQRFSEMITYQDLQVPANDQGILPEQSLNNLAAITLEKIAAGLGV